MANEESTSAQGNVGDDLPKGVDKAREDSQRNSGADGWQDLTDVLPPSARNTPWESGPTRSPPAGAAAASGVFLGRFMLVSEVGRGGCGVVYRAHDSQEDRIVALKIPRAEFHSDEDSLERFEREAKIVAALEHPGIVPVYEAGQHDGMSYIVSQFCDGPDLRRWLQRHPASLTPSQAAELVATLAEALEYAHRQGVVHRDVKPGNVLLVPHTDDGAAQGRDSTEFPYVARLTDFGLARMQSAEWTQTRTSLVIGTPLYMAPECFTKESDKWNASNDIYSLGAMFYELLTGAPPLQGEEFGQLLDRIRHDEPEPAHVTNPNVPLALSSICHKCLAKEPDLRYASAQELADDLRRFLSGNPVQARLPTRWDRFQRWRQRPRRLVTAGIFSIAYHLLAVAWLLVGLSVASSMGLLSREQFFLNVIDITLAGLIVHFPKAWLGWLVIRGRRWAFWPALVTSLGCLVMFTVALGVQSPLFEFNYPNKLSMISSFTILSGSSLVETVLYALAIPAFWKR